MAKDAVSSAYGSVSDHFKHITDKLSGGTGMVDHKGEKNIPGFAQRMYQAGGDAKSMPPQSAQNSMAEINSVTKSSMSHLQDKNK
jgi:hypothetical protein